MDAPLSENDVTTVHDVCKLLTDGKFSKVVVLCGAGISVSCGIPDFRSPGTGLYSQLENYGLPRPEAVFDLDFFQHNPKPFYSLAQNMFPDKFQPSPAHAFIRLLQDQGILYRCFTQNIDTLERAAGVDPERLIEAHGSFASASCIKCKTPFDHGRCRERILQGGDQVPIYCEEEDCGGLVKHDIVFFGENLPKRFKVESRNLGDADLLIVMGTSLSVYPFAELVHLVAPHTPRLLLNNVPVGVRGPQDRGRGLRLRQHDNFRDTMLQGTCDDGVRAVCDAVGWREQLESIVESLRSVNQNRAQIKLDESFPDMPNGLCYDWNQRVSQSLPPPRNCTSYHDARALVNIACNDKSHVAAQRDQNSEVAFFYAPSSDGPPTAITEGQKAVFCLCVARDDWDEDDYVALVPSGSQEIPYEAFADFAYLSQPQILPTKQRGNLLLFRVSVFPRCPTSLESIRDDRSPTTWELWHVSNELGQVLARYGPFEMDMLDEPLLSDEESDDEGETSEATSGPDDQDAESQSGSSPLATGEQASVVVVHENSASSPAPGNNLGEGGEQNATAAGDESTLEDKLSALTVSDEAIPPLAPSQ